jgi:hypothetical protein
VTLRAKQSRFVWLVGQLILHAYAQGYELTYGDAYRSPEEAARLAAARKGIKNSLHTQRLAIDLNLFQHGVYLSSTESHRPLGEFWESLSTPEIECCWGGRFKDSQGRPRPDGNHYSIRHQGRA